MGADNLLILQGGGPTPVVNATLASALTQAYSRGKRKILGARHSIEGLISNQLVDLSNHTPAQVKRLSRTPGAALGSSRVKATEQELESIINRLRKLDIHEALFIGGNGTMRAAHAFSDFCRGERYELRIIGVPKTIDNDIQGTDRCPGYGSAARYVAQSTRDLGMDVRALPQPVSIFETMGRSVGWLAAASAMAKRDEQDAPQLVCLPEIPFVVDKFLAALDRILKKQSWAIVVVCEGIRNSAGNAVYEPPDRLQADALKRPMPGGVARHLAKIVTRELKVRCRDEKPGLIGRASMLHASTQDLADAEFVGSAAVCALDGGHSDKMVSLSPLRGAGEPASTLVPLASVTGSDRLVPQDWLCDGDVPVNRKFLEYAQPLIGELLDYEFAFGSVEGYANA